MELVGQIVKKLIVLGIIAGVGVFGWGKYQEFVKQQQAKEITLEKLRQLTQGMTKDQVKAILGESKRETKGGTERENGVQSGNAAASFSYYRNGSVMLVWNADGQLIEVCVGETNDDYYARKMKKEKVLWQNFPTGGFIHSDAGASGSGGTGVGAGAAGGIVQ